MNELGMMGGNFDMGTPYESMSDPMMDPQLAMSIQMLVEQYGLSPEQAMELAMTQQQQDPMATPRGVLGQPSPRLQDADYMMLAQQFGLDPTTTLGGQDPAYDQQYDIASVLGGPYEP